MKRLRVVLMTTAAVLTALGCIGAEIVLASQEDQYERSLRQTKCRPYLLIPQEQVCGQNVIYTNPDGSKSRIGSLSAFLPMPKPQTLEERR